MTLFFELEVVCCSGRYAEAEKSLTTTERAGKETITTAPTSSGSDMCRNFHGFVLRGELETFPPLGRISRYSAFHPDQWKEYQTPFYSTIATVWMCAMKET